MAKVKCPQCSYVNPDAQDACVKCKTPLPKIRIAAKAGPASRQASAHAIQFRRDQVVADRYTVLKLIGRGGMGCIYKVHDNTLGEDVALKTLLPQFAQDKMVVERFFNEARIARKLAHPNIVRVHDIGHAGSILYISMEHLQGKSLRELLDDLPAGQSLPLARTLHIFDGLCAALEYAHQYTIHRDIKPENIMIMPDGTVKLMDFGISKLMANTRLTAPSMVMGTPFYMSPEQLRNSRDVDARADIFSVGVMLYEVLTGSVPTGIPKTASQMRAGVPPEMDAIVGKCVDPDPAGRYASASELRAALQAIEEGHAKGGGRRRRSTAMEGRPRAGAAAGTTPGAARKAVGAILAFLLVLAMAAGVFALEMRRQQRSSVVGGVGAASESDDRFSELERLVEDVSFKAEERAGDSPELQAICDEADALWERASRAFDSDNRKPRALVVGRQALQCYLAPLLWREGMVFIPAGTVTVDGNEQFAEAFLIDETEVTMGQFAAFDREVDGGWRLTDPAVAAPRWAEYPITNVTFYDAQACAVWQGKRLPTVAQWLRAAYHQADDESADYPWGAEWDPGACRNKDSETVAPAPAKWYARDLTASGCYDMAGNVAEWSRTPASGSPAGSSPYFGTSLVVMGGDFSQSEVALRATRTASFESRSPGLGFRCVLEIPTDPKAVESILANFP